MSCLNDDALGPAVQGCRGDFDFTIKFEKIFFSIIPASIFITLALARIAHLIQKPRIIHAVAFQSVKILLFVIYAALQLSRVVILATARGNVVHELSVASSALTFVASVPMIALSFFAHARSPRPSMLLSSYILITLLLDVVQTRTLWLTITQFPLALDTKIFTTTVALKAVILLVEAKKKTKWIHWVAAEHSPEESSGIFSIGFFSWLNRLFWCGYKGVITMDDLYSLDQRMASEGMYDRLAARLNVGDLNEKRLGLARALAKALVWPLLLPAAPRMARIGFGLCQPFFISSLLRTIDGRNEPGLENQAYGLIGACALIWTGIALSMAFHSYFAERSMCMARGCLASAIYKKTTESKITAADDAAAVTLMSTDVERIVTGFAQIHEVWACTIEVALGCWLLQQRLGFAFLSPVIIIIVCSAAITWVGSVAGKRQAAWMGKIQTRVGLTANVISHMKQLKISGIAEPVGKLIHALRLEELDVGCHFRRITILAAVIAFSPGIFSPVLAFALGGRDLDVAAMYESLSFLVLLTNPLSMLFQGVPRILAGFTCLDRIQKFLETESRQDFRRGNGSEKTPADEFSTDSKTSNEDAKLPEAIPLRVQQRLPKKNEAVVSIVRGNFGWTEEKSTLHDINTTIRSGQLTMVVGPVACGKSTLCKAILGEVPFATGEVRLNHPLWNTAFCEQTPYLVNATVKENIVKHASFDQRRYDEVVEVTALGRDISMMASGHDTNIGSGGIALSGGQRNRLSLARALYHGSPLVILDDVLSGLDNNTESEVFRRVFGPQGLLRRRGATVLLCTHSVRHLPSADHIIALGMDGSIVEQGTFATLSTQGSYVNSLGVQAIELQEEKEEKAADAKVPPTTQAEEKGALANAMDDRSRQMGDRTVYKYYFSTISNQIILILFAGAVLWSVGFNFPAVWVGFWAVDRLDQSNAFYIGIYALLATAGLFGIFISATMCMIHMIKSASAELHKGALATVLHAPLTFFTTTNNGVITNLFSQDTTIIDSQLPMALLNFVLDGFSLIGMCIVIAVASPHLAITYPFLMALLWVIQKFYLRTSRQLRLLDLEAKSPLYANFLDTIRGIATIRAFGWTAQDIADNNALLDTSQRPAYLLIMIQQWLALTMNMVVALMATLLVCLATQLKSSSGFTGASLITLMSLGEVASNIIQSYTLLETSIGAVGRLKTFSATVSSEDVPGEDTIPDEQWPTHGKIEIENVSASYEAHAEEEKAGKLVLKDINLSIRAGEKVAVCGRTGSGKSSFILLLLRLLDPTRSNLHKFNIDDIPVQSLDRSTLRKRIIAIPQDCVFLPEGSSIKANIDPFSTATDEDCQTVLQSVRLSDFVRERGGLHSGMSADHLSAGQKQLFSLGRAILRRRVRDNKTSSGGILLLDEVSSGVDQETERLMQEIIRDEFASYTIVSVAHRLDIVARFSDRVVVLEQGSVVEAGAPQDLLQQPQSWFKDLWESGHYS